VTGSYPLDALASLPNFYHPFARGESDDVAVYYDETGRNELYVIDTETGDRTRVSDGNVPRNAMYPFYAGPEADRFYFHQDEGGDEQNDIMCLHRDGTVEPVIATDAKCDLTDVSADGRFLLYTSDASGQMNLHRYDRSTEESTQLTTHERPVTNGLLGPDGERIAYTTNESDDPDNQDVYVAGADGSGARNLEIGDVGAETGVVDWHPDGTALLVSDNTTDRPRCGVYDLDADTVEWYTDEAHVEEPVAFRPDARGFVATRTRECAVAPVAYDLGSGDSRELDLPEGVAEFSSFGGYFRYPGSVFLSETELVVAQRTPTQRPRLLVYDLATDETRTLIEPEYGDLDPSGFVDCSYETYESHDGLEIEALLYDSGVRPSPAVVKVHGGPYAQDRREFDLEAQFLASRGYSVLAVNYRGSTGRGREFKNRVNQDFGGDEQGDIAAGTRWLAAKDWVDEDRIAVTGLSYGGYSTYMQLLQYPDLYAAGIARVGITDFPALYEESMPHFKTLLEDSFGDPEADADRYRERSPTQHVENLSAPLCIVHGVNDPRCPISQARLFRDALDEHGFTEGEDYEYNEFGEEGHASTDTDHTVRSLGIIEEFLERRMPVTASTPEADDD